MTASRRLLVIDDSPTIRKLVEISFKRTNWTIEFARSGSEGIAQASRSQPDLVLLDFVLPDMRGTDVCAGLARDDATARIPVLVMSGKGDAVRGLFRSFAAVIDVIGKPFAAADIVTRANRAVSAEGAPPPSPSGPKDDEAFEGRLGPVGQPLQPIDLLRALAARDASGELALRYGDQDVRVQLRRGAIVLAATDDPAAYEQAKQTLHAALDARAVRFSWRAADDGAAHLDPDGRVLPLTQLALERLRREPPRAASSYAVDRVFERAKGFSRRVRGVELSDAERRVLALVDGRASLEEIGQRAALGPLQVNEVAARLRAVELVRERAGADSAGPILVADPDTETFAEPLRVLFAERSDPVRTVSVEAGEEIYEAIVRERPRMVIVNATALGAAAARAAEAVRTSAGFGDLPLVAVLEEPAASAETELAMLGFDAVLTKPVLFSELERLLSA